ncbi:MAG TPA: lipid-binding SYLF domain-containing protein [Rariglobus sp.]|jgi:lipid-binding SYLF domain-containing protein|nr:lipid-binding SYLF domain-containing protein [Rariglobus sp.]
MKKLLCLLLGLMAAATLRADANADSGTFVKRVETCEAILREFQESPATAVPAEVLRGAKAIVITNQIQGGFILGFKAGYGTILVKKPDGQWSIPVLINAGNASLGLQLGGSAVQTVYIVMDEKTPRLLFEGRFNIGVDAQAVAGPHVSEKESTNRELLTTPVLVYSKKKGLYAGATVKTGFLTRSDAINRAYYGVPYDLPELLYGNFVQPTADVKPLMDYVTQLSP